MKKYYCIYCEYDAKVKGNYDKHVNTKKHQMLIIKESIISRKLCKYCNRTLSKISRNYSRYEEISRK